MYKDLVVLLQNDTYLTETDLRKKVTHFSGLGTAQVLEYLEILDRSGKCELSLTVL